jgi:hypothetical protein
MKKIPYLIAFFTLIISCGGNGDQSTSTVSSVTQGATQVATQAATQVAATQVAATQVAATQVAATQVAAQVAATQVAATQVAATQVAATQVATPVAATQVAATQVATQVATPVATQAATQIATQAATPVTTQVAVQPASSSTMQGMDPSKMQGMDPSKMQGMDPSKMQGMDPSKMQAATGTNDPPELQNLLILNFGPYDSVSTSGDFEFISGFPYPFFDEFGRVHSAGSPDQYDNPTFEYKVPRDTKIYLPISGIIDSITWQPTASYKQDDWELIINPSVGSDWRVVIDHVVAITCDRSKSSVCDDALLVNGIPLAAGSEVNAGDLLGYVGNYEGSNGSDAFGRTEITIGEYITEGKQKNFMNYCPTNYLSADVKDKILSDVKQIMASYESWSGNSSFYDEAAMVASGCRYTKIYEVDGKTTPTR